MAARRSAASDRFAEAFRAFEPKPAERLERHLPAGDASCLYFVGGADGYLRQRSLARIAAHHLGESPAPYRERRLHAGHATADRLRSASQTVSFGGGPVVSLSGLRIGSGSRRASKPELWEAVCELVETPPPGAVVAVEWEESPDRRRRGWKAFAARLTERIAAGGALVVDCDPPPEAKMPAWIRAEAGRQGLALPEGGAELLAGRFGPDLRRQRAELRKLALFAAPEEEDGGGGGADPDAGGEAPVRVDLEAMEQLLGGGSARNLFRFTNAVQGGRAAEALEVLDLLLSEREPPQALLALLYRLATQVQAANAFRPGRGSGSLREAIGMHRAPPRAVEEIASAARRFTAEELRGVVRQVIETDFRMKSTGIPARVALSSLALLLARGGAPEGSARRG